MGCFSKGAEPEHEEKKTHVKLERSCQDCFFLVLFVLFWCGMVGIAIKAGRIGEPDRLTYGTDSWGNLCGKNNLLNNQIPANKSLDMTNKKNLYYLFVPPFDSYYKICVENCPKVTYFPPESADELLCANGVNASMKYVDNISGGYCYGTYASTPVLHRCFPVIISNITQLNFTELLAFSEIISHDLNLDGVKNVGGEILGDVVRSWKYILACAGIAVVLGLLWIILLRFFAGAFVWFSIAFVLAALVVTSYIAHTQSQELQDKYNATPSSLRLNSEHRNIVALRWISIIVAVLGAILLLVLTFMLGRIQVAIGIIKETSKALIIMPSIFFFPILIFLFLLGLASYWLYVAALLATAGEPTYEDDVYVGYKYANGLKYTQLYHLFGGFWSMNLILAIGQCTIAGSIAAWYWVHDKKDVPMFPVAKALKRTLRYHLGSLAFGSLILAVAQTIRVILQYLEKQFRGNQYRLARFFIRILECIVACFERFIKFINKNAYIMIAIYGYSFCAAARRGFILAATNFVRVAALNFVSKFLMFIGKLFICLTTCFIAFIMLKADGTITFYVLPVILIGVISYAISTAFMNVWEMAVDTMLLCFCEDCDRNDGSAEKPYYMSNSMRHYMNTWSDMCCCCEVGDAAEQGTSSGANTVTVAAK